MILYKHYLSEISCLSALPFLEIYYLEKYLFILFIQLIIL
jgi:hypothetical protein